MDVDGVEFTVALEILLPDGRQWQTSSSQEHEGDLESTHPGTTIPAHLAHIHCTPEELVVAHAMCQVDRRLGNHGVFFFSHGGVPRPQLPAGGGAENRDDADEEKQHGEDLHQDGDFLR